ncbi:MAG: non-ribosomal peptide synthase/polyketide synthase [Ferruginibacter sp.]
MKDDQLIKKTLIGKTGKDLLSLLGAKEKRVHKNIIAPSGATEVTLYEFWKSLLGHDVFGVNDDFFRAGGNSLKAIQLLSRISAQFAVDIKLTDVFLQPTIAQLALVIDGMKNAAPALHSLIEVKERPQNIPLSFNQERLWFIDQLEGSIQYHIPAVFNLEGSINTAGLGFAFAQIVQRHEALRTIIRDDAGHGFQHIQNGNGWKLSVSDGSGFQNDKEGLQQTIQQAINAPFDLSKDYMLRAALISISNTKHVLVITLHHIASDGWSTSIIVKELVELYQSYGTNTAPQLEPLPLQYADFAIWQRQYLQGNILDKKLGYWKQQLDGVTTLQLPTDYPRTAVQTYNGSLEEFTIDRELTDQLQVLSEQQGVTMFMTLLAAFKILLYRYTGQQDISVGTATAGRQQQLLEGLIGFFVNTLALRSSVDSDSSFNEFLQQVKRTSLEAFENQEVPFEKVVETVVKERSMSSSPLFQVMFVLQNTPDKEAIDLSGVALSEAFFENNRARFELDLSLADTPEGLEVSVVYCTDLYNGNTIKRMMAHFTELLKAGVKNPEEKIGLLPMLTNTEKEQLLVRFNHNTTNYPAEKSIATIFEEQAVDFSDKIALVFGEQELTYRQLNERSNQLAHYIKVKGVQSETLVPIFIERSVEMLVAILGVLKAGGAYVPLDPAYPTDRINFMLQDIKAGILLSSKISRLALPPSNDIEIISVDEEWAVISTQPVTNLSAGTGPANLAYVMYTSGSTGRPKGVMVTQQNVISLVKGIDYVGLTSNDVLLSTGSSSFDATTFEYWSMLLNGGTLVLCAENRLLDDQLLKDEINSRKISLMWFTSSWFNQLVETDITVFEGLQTILAGGEKLSPHHIQKLRQTYPHIKVINGYGPTENTTFSLTYHVTEKAIHQSIPIGKPLSNRNAWILDGNNQLVPVGVNGEICLGGAGLSKGYLNQPELSANKFIPHPFSDLAEVKIYKTGDIGRWLPDGNIEYQGRIDEQVKIRGYRIELGEIESVLQQSELVSQAVVVAKEDNRGNKLLIGYVVPSIGFNKEVLIAYLRNRLPEYMVPLYWVELTTMPLTSNGKVNKKAFPDTDVTAMLVNKYAAPATELEIKLATTWQNLLGVKLIGIHDNFFELGGHSLLAMRLIATIRKEMGTAISIKELFIHPTVASLANHLAQLQKTILLPVIEKQVRPILIPLSFSQERLWFIDQLEGSVQYHLPSVFRLKGKISRQALNDALQNIINRHEVLRTVFLEEEGQGYQFIKNTNEWKLNVIEDENLTADDLQLREALQQLIDAPFDLSKDDMLRASLIGLQPDEHLLVVVMHHIASDAWSLPIIMKEVAALYTASLQQYPSQLQPLPIQYADYSIWQRNHLNGQSIENSLRYWEQQLEGVSPLQLPTDSPRPAVLGTRGALAQFELDNTLSEQLMALGKREGATLFMTLLAAFNVLLNRYSGQTDITVGTPVANRTHPEVVELIGFFVNSLALRASLEDNPTFTSLLQQVKQTTLEAYDHQELPFEKVVGVTVKDRDLSRSPLFQVMLVFQNDERQQIIELAGLEMSAENFAGNTSKFELVLNITETGSGLKGSVEYNTDLYNESTILRMIGHFRQLLNAIVEKPDQSISQLQMLTQAETDKLLIKFNDTHADYPKDKTIVNLIEEQVEKFPSNIAVVFEKEQLTYQQLNERSNQLAHYLRSKGVEADTLVPVCLERNMDMIIGIVGILKAGGAYVPIDPDYPGERIQYMLEDTGAKLIVCGKDTSEKITGVSAIEQVVIDENAVFNNHPATNLQVPLQPHHLAYVIYTSGSTGKPKGVLIEHRNIIRLFKAEPALYDFDEKDVWSVFHSFSFDFSVWEMYGALFYGGRMVVVPKHVTKDVTEFAELLMAEKVTVLNQTPSAFYVLQESMVQETTTLPVRYVIFGGEALNPAKLQPWKKTYPNCRLINMYGITETTVHVTYQQIEWQHTLGGKSIIGKPIPTLSAYIVDSNQNLVPIGVAGELMIGGAGLARGYLNRPELTAERFIQDPFSKEAGARLYRTGDSGMWLPDGNIEYLGRIDEQVKIRGYRIELGEIETILHETSSVHQAVVLAKADKDGNKRLVGYIVPDGEFNREGIVAYLQAKLPDYMIPALWVELKTLPLTPNGKIDKKALPDPDASSHLQKQFVAPATEDEKKIAAIWKEILNVNQVGIHDNFFELGGDSIKVIRVVNKLKKAFHKDVKVFHIYHAGSLSQLIPLIEGSPDVTKNINATAEIKEELSLLRNATILLLPDATNVEDIYPMSDIQSGMIFASLMNPGLSIYHEQFIYQLDKHFETGIFESAIALLVNKHAILRTGFNLDIHSEGLQIVYKKVPVHIEYIDEQGLTDKDARSFIEAYLEKGRSAPFQIDKVPLLRFTIINFADHRALIFQFHHALLDGWSVASFNTELNNLCLGMAANKVSPQYSVPLKCTYKDFIIESIAEKRNDHNIAFWQQEMSDYKRLDIFSEESVNLKYLKKYNRGYLDLLNERTKQDGLSIKGLFHAAYLFALSMLTPEEDITVGLVTNTRPLVEDGDQLLGCFLNTIPFRAKLNQHKSSWKTYFNGIENKLKDIKQRDRTTLMQITLLTGEKNLHENPFFDALYSFINFHVYDNFETGLLRPEQPLEDLETSEDPLGSFLTNTYLNFLVIITADGLELNYLQRKKLKSGKTLQDINRYIEQVIDCYLHHYEEPVHRNAIIAEDDRQLLLASTNKLVVYPKNKSVVELFEEQVIKSPQAVALVFEGQQLTYGELNSRANQLAAYLRSRGVNQETLVPIYMERGIDMMVGIMGILKAGAAYVPVDVEFPSDRISYMLEDIGASVLLTNAESVATLSIETDIDVIEIDPDSPEIRLQPTQDTHLQIKPTNAAYVIYTSGSTGKPKGVIIEHKSLIDYVFGLNNEVQINDCKSFAVVSTIATDLGNTVIYASLLSGGALHLFSKDATTNVETLHEYFAGHRIDCLKIVPSHWKALCMGEELLLPVKLIVFGGEALRTEMVEDIIASGATCKIVNHYGPTETTIGKLLHQVQPGRAYGSTIPIGKPFSNTSVYVLTKSMELCPVGVPGQLFIAGDGVARGYFNKAEITKEKFIPDPFALQSGAGMYRTGDLVKYLPDGNIEFIGRVDDQVKIHGYRIELGEIETIMSQCELVSQAVVLAREDKRGDKRLVAYIVGKADYDKEELVVYLKGRLPGYMIPALMVELESLPLTANGKIDRKALPDPEMTEVQAGEYAAPRNEVEKILAEIWQELLDIGQVGIHDNFFELGGDSIITIQLVSRARRAGCELQMGDVFTYQTIARLSALLDQRADTSSEVSGEQFILEGESGLLPIQQWYFDKDPIAVSHFNQTLLLGIDKEITPSLLKRAVEQLTTHHDALRFKYYKKDARWFQVYEHQSEVNRVFTEDLRASLPGELTGFIASRSNSYQRSLDIEKGELVKFVLIQTPGSENLNRLLIVIHHLAVDGVSWRILLEDLELLFSGLKTGGQTDLGKKTSSFRQWYQTLEKYGQTEKLLGQKPYWDKAVAAFQSLPVDKSYVDDISIKDTTRYSMHLGAAQTRRLTHDVPKVYHTEINDILLAALAKTIHEFTNAADIVIGMEGHGRENIDPDIDTSRTVGWFTTHYPVLLQVNETLDAASLIKTVKEQLRQVPDKGIGFGVLKYINNESSYRSKPSWDIVFNYLGQADNIFSAGNFLSVATESAGAERSEQFVVTDKLAINGMVQGGELMLTWTYSEKHYRQETVISLVDKFKHNLEQLIDHCLQRANAGKVGTPSDFGLGKEITYHELDKFLAAPFRGKARKESFESMYRLSGLQQGMLFHGLYDEGGAGYINHFWSDLLDPNLDIFKKSWKHVLKAHSVLRSAFYHDAFNAPVQVVYQEAKLPIEVIDLRGLDDAAQAIAILAFAEADKAKGFDFTQPPLMRIALLRLDDHRYRMLWSSHHILFDGWSRSILMGEFLKVYESYVSVNSPLQLPEDKYEDYIRYIEKIDQNKETAYWTNYLSGIEQSTLLPFIATSMAERNKGIGIYGSFVLEISEKSTAKIESFAQANRITINTVMQGVWSYLLHRYTGNRDIVYGVIVSGRPEDLSHVEQRIGMFINALPLHSSLTEAEPVIKWLQNIQQEQVASRQYQYTSLHQVQAWSGVQGDLFDSLLVFENYPVSKVLASMQWSLQVENVSVKEQTNYPLCLIINSGESINIDFNYNTALLSEQGVREISAHFENVLIQLIEKSNAAMQDIELLTANEATLLQSFNDTKTDYPNNKTLVDLFEEQVLRTPLAIANSFEGSQLTYQELNEKSNQLGNYLRANGVKEETLVPVLLDRSLEMIIGILGVLKAGAAYVPIDPEYPAERIAYMLDDTAATWVLTTKDASACLVSNGGVHLLDLVNNWPAIAQQPVTKVANQLLPGNVAYVIYTSGSSGKPKGVMNEHGAVVNRLWWAQNYYRLTPADIVLQKTTFCFDVSVWELLWPLLAGAKQVFAKPGGHKDPAYLRHIIEAENITMVHFVPSMLSVFLADVSEGECKGLAKVLCSGEALKKSHVEQFVEKLPGSTLHNLYGPTEAAIDVTYWSLQAGAPIPDIVPIGKPVFNTRIHILDKRDKLVPMGAVGEIHIAGVQVARGYLNRNELTAQKFVPDTFSKDASEKMYRTGDLGRWTNDGNVEYLGRIDEQVKIRGFRIELGEIETTLSAMEGVQDAKVIVAENEAMNDKELNAYLEINKRQLPLLHNYVQLLRDKKIHPPSLNILPTGLPIFDANNNEVKFLYDEIFKDASYLKHGINLKPGSCVMDIGANVGFFTVFLNVLSPDIKVYSFEPIPEVYDHLVANRELYNVAGKAFQLALLDKQQEIEFDYYPQMTILSSIGGDPSKVKDVVRAYVENSQDTKLAESEMDALLELKLESKKLVCQAKTLSQIIAEESIEKIDLLKIDVENSEHLVIAGLVDSDWAKIESLIVEVHDSEGRLDKMVQLFTEKGFVPHVEKENILSADDILYNIYAIRKSTNGNTGLKSLGTNEASRLKGWKSPGQLIGEVKSQLQTLLPGYMVPADFVLMDRFPLTSNGKLDKRALPVPESSTSQKEYKAPVTATEITLTGIWQQLLGNNKIGLADNFFEMGGHSLLAMRMISAVRREMEKEIPIKTIFQHPTILELAAIVDEGEKGTALPAITVQKRPRRVPLSFSQERLWFIDKLEGTLQYHLPSIIRLKGSLNKAALANTLQQIVDRHEVLRTVILEEQGAGYQQVKEKGQWQMNIGDEFIFEDGSLALRQYIQQLVKSPFNLSTDYKLRAQLIKLGEAEQILVVTMHHIAADGWSTSIIVNELMELYAAFEAGRIAQLQPLPIQYADYAIWQRNYLKGAVLDKKLAYWKGKLDGVATLQLPADYTRPVVQSTRGARTFFTIDKDLSERILALSQQQGSTLFMTLLTAYKILLYRYSGQPDICVGTPIANRTQQELESLIGFFINTLALRSDLSGNPTFTGLLQQVKATTLEAYEHQDMPFEKVVEAVVKERDMSRNPLFQVLFTMQNTPAVPELRLGNIHLSLEEQAHTTSQLDIICNITETPEGLYGSVEYCTDLYTEATIQQMMLHFRQLLASIVKTPAQKIGELQMLSVTERQQLLFQFNDTAANSGTESGVIDLFEAQVALNPMRLAAVFGEEEFSFLQLNEKANQLAAVLQLKGVKAEKLVPVCISRSVDMLVAILAILKAGGAYVPIDPEYPLERISYLLEDTNATVVLCNDESLSKLPDEAQLHVISIDDDWPLISTMPVVNLALAIQPTQLAYVIYTSGSTGKPKGVLIEHRNMLSYLLNEKTKYITGHSANAGSFVHLSYTFDASLTAMFMPLLAGKPVVISSKASLDVFEDANLHKYAPYDFIKITPAHLALIQPVMQTPNGTLLTKRLVLGGEALHLGQFSQLVEDGLNIEVINEYGPTEATVGCSVFSFQTIGDEEKLKGGIAIGKPIDNVQLHILGVYNELVPMGVTGELCIGGHGVARGYLNRAGLTAEKFVADPFNSGLRIYKTGDLARWLPDGNIEYLGRKDEQVKIRGYRIELGEIEGVLQDCEYVSQAVVLAKDNKEGTKRLVGYIVPTGEFEKEAIQDYLKNSLPEYMIPVQWVAMETFPLTSNGKVDRKALPDPEAAELLTNEFVGPRNDFEKAVAEIWQYLLDVEEVGIHDNFFELGGDSIIIIQIVSRARRAGYEFQVADVFTHQTIAGLSAMMDQQTDSTAVMGEQGLLTGTVGLLPIQQWYLESDITDISHFNQSVLLQIDKAITKTDIALALDALVSHHDALRFIYHREEGQWQQEYGSKKAGLIVEDLQAFDAEKCSKMITEKASFYQHSLDIEKGDIIKMVLMQTSSSDDKNRLLIIIHHLAIDGISWRIILEDLEHLLTDLKNSKPVDLGKRTSSYRQWYEALVEYGNSSRLLLQRKHWEQVVNNYQPLRVDKAYEGKVTVKDMGNEEIRLSNTQTRLLLQEVPKAYHTEINDILMTALAVTLCEWGQTSEVVIGLEGHGREPIADGIDTSHTVGWFTSMYPVLMKVEAGNEMSSAIREIKEQLRMIPDKGLGYGVLKYIDKEEKLVDKKCWDIVFNYFGQLDNVVSKGKWLSTATESKGSGISEHQLVKDLISVNGQVQSGEMILSWSYSTLHYGQQTIRELAQQYRQNLQLLIVHCIEQQKTRSVFTPSDYGLGKEITNAELDLFLNEPLEDGIRRDWIEGIYRLSGLQQGMLFHGLYDRRAGAYTEQLSCELKGPDLDAFKKSWDFVISKHTILRTGFYHDVFSVPVQCVYSKVELPVVYLDYRHLDADEQFNALKEYDATDLALGFNFKSVPLMRIALTRLSDNVYRMLWTSHHILYDGWSIPVLMEEFLTTYELLVAGKQPLKGEEDKYEDYIRYIERLDKDKARQYWVNYLKGVEQSTLLPFVGNTPDRNKGIGLYKSLSFKLNADQSAEVEKFAQKNHLTVNTLMQGVWSLLLHNYTGSNNIVYGVTVSGRPDDLPGVEQRVGMYINTLPLHSDISHKQNITEWLQGIQDDQVKSRHHQYTSLGDIQGWSPIKGDLFDSLLVVENYPVSKVIAAGKWSLEVDDVKVSEQTNFPLSIFISIADQVSVRFNYNTGLLTDEHLANISGHFENVLIQLVQKGEGRLQDIELLTPDEKQQLLIGFSGPVQSFSPGKSIITLVEEQAARKPHNIAVVMDDEKLTFRELNERANQLAHYLKTMGVTKDALVPVCIERSVQMIVGMLGILKAGGAYVPVDPEYPADRILYTIEDTGAKLIISSKKSIEKLPEATGVNIISLDEDWQLISNQPVTNLSLPVEPGQLAYMIYTSGSTGKPKGVMIRHSNVYAFINWCQQEFASSHFEMVYAGTSICFDLSVFEIFYPLSVGKPLRILENGLHIGKYLAKDAFVMTNSVPGVIQSLLSEGISFTNISVINMAGEPVPGKLLQSLDTENIEVRNLYGPTEDTTYSTMSRLINTAAVNIGKPISNTSVYIVNKEQKLVPVGVTGEICISGAGIAKGYHNRPELTNEKFVTNPFVAGPESLMYKTGDWGRWLPDGNIEYLGRMDEQVKIRGYRIELGEIESVLQLNELVSKAVVLARLDKDGDKRLVAYIVPKDVFQKESLINYLKARLPEYMVPGLWVELEDLPLTPNGKVDRKALPDPDALELSGNQYVAPRNKIESQLAEIWKEILVVERVGVHDNFFELGGHSLLVMRLISSIRKELKIELPIASLFELGTIGELASYITVNLQQEPVALENFDTITL